MSEYSSIARACWGGLLDLLDEAYCMTSNARESVRESPEAGAALCSTLRGYVHRLDVTLSQWEVATGHPGKEITEP